MKLTDVQAIIRTFRRLPVPGSVLVFSPAWDANADGCSEKSALEAVWPGATISECDKGRWNLDNQRPLDIPTCEVGLICNTFMCSHDPGLWLRHISSAVDVLIVQDLAACSRGTVRKCSVETGDVARYSVSSHGIIGETDFDLSVFDFSTCGRELIDVERYEDDGLKFVVALRLSKERHRAVSSMSSSSSVSSLA